MTELLDSPSSPAAPSNRRLTSLLVRQMLQRRLQVAVLKHRLSWVAERRAMFGALPVGTAEGIPLRHVRRLTSAQI